jgi:RNA chaperone Hfq
VIVYLLNGAKLTGRIRSFDKFSVLLESGSQEQLIFKHAISTISQSRRATGDCIRRPTRNQPARSRVTTPTRLRRDIRLNSREHFTGMRTVPGTFITFEGIDGSGKVDSVAFAGQFPEANGCDALLTREPGGTRWAAIASALAGRDGGSRSIDRTARLCRDRAQHVRRMLRPALEAGQVVISGLLCRRDSGVSGSWKRFIAELISQIVNSRPKTQT